MGAVDVDLRHGGALLQVQAGHADEASDVRAAVALLVGAVVDDLIARNGAVGDHVVAVVGVIEGRADQAAEGIGADRFAHAGVEVLRAALHAGRPVAVEDDVPDIGADSDAEHAHGIAVGDHVQVLDLIALPVEAPAEPAVDHRSPVVDRAGLPRAGDGREPGDAARLHVVGLLPVLDRALQEHLVHVFGLLVVPEPGGVLEEREVPGRTPGLHRPGAVGLVVPVDILQLPGGADLVDVPLASGGQLVVRLRKVRGRQDDVPVGIQTLQRVGEEGRDGVAVGLYALGAVEGQRPDAGALPRLVAEIEVIALRPEAGRIGVKGILDQLLVQRFGHGPVPLARAVGDAGGRERDLLLLPHLHVVAIAELRDLAAVVMGGAERGAGGLAALHGPDIGDMVSVVGAVLLVFPVEHAEGAEHGDVLPVAVVDQLARRVADHGPIGIAALRCVGMADAVGRGGPRGALHILEIQIGRARSAGGGAAAAVASQDAGVEIGALIKIIAALHQASVRREAVGAGRGAARHQGCGAVGLLDPSVVPTGKAGDADLASLGERHLDVAKIIAVADGAAVPVPAHEAADVHGGVQAGHADGGAVRGAVLNGAVVLAHQSAHVEAAVGVAVERAVRTGDVVSGRRAVIDDARVASREDAHIDALVDGDVRLALDVEARVRLIGLIVRHQRHVADRAAVEAEHAHVVAVDADKAHVGDLEAVPVIARLEGMGRVPADGQLGGDHIAAPAPGDPPVGRGARRRAVEAGPVVAGEADVPPLDKAADRGGGGEVSIIVAAHGVQMPGRPHHDRIAAVQPGLVLGQHRRLGKMGVEIVEVGALRPDGLGMDLHPAIESGLHRVLVHDLAGEGHDHIFVDAALPDRVADRGVHFRGRLVGRLVDGDGDRGGHGVPVEAEDDAVAVAHHHAGLLQRGVHVGAEEAVGAVVVFLVIHQRAGLEFCLPVAVVPVDLQSRIGIGAERLAPQVVGHRVSGGGRKLFAQLFPQVLAGAGHGRGARGIHAVVVGEIVDLTGGSDACRRRIDPRRGGGRHIADGIAPLSVLERPVDQPGSGLRRHLETGRVAVGHGRGLAAGREAAGMRAVEIAVRVGRLHLQSAAGQDLAHQTAAALRSAEHRRGEAVDDRHGAAVGGAVEPHRADQAARRLTEEPGIRIVLDSDAAVGGRQVHAAAADGIVPVPGGAGQRAHGLALDADAGEGQVFHLRAAGEHGKQSAVLRAADAEPRDGAVAAVILPEAGVADGLEIRLSPRLAVEVGPGPAVEAEPVGPAGIHLVLGEGEVHQLLRIGRQRKPGGAVQILEMAPAEDLRGERPAGGIIAAAVREQAVGGHGGAGAALQRAVRAAHRQRQRRAGRDLLPGGMSAAAPVQVDEAQGRVGKVVQRDLAVDALPAPVQMHGIVEGQHVGIALRIAVAERVLQRQLERDLRSRGDGALHQGRERFSVADRERGGQGAGGRGGGAEVAAVIADLRPVLLPPRLCAQRVVAAPLAGVFPGQVVDLLAVKHRVDGAELRVVFDHPGVVQQV